MTGRGMGVCAGYAAPGWANPGRGSRRGGYAFGGGGRGWRNRYYATGLPRWARGPWSSIQGAPPAWPYGAPLAPLTREREIEMLTTLRLQLAETMNRIERLEGDADKKAK